MGAPKHATSLNPRLTTARGSHLRDCASENCFICWPVPCRSDAKPDIFDIVLTEVLVLLVQLRINSAVSSGQLTVLIVSTCSLSFQTPLSRLGLEGTDWAAFQVYVEDTTPENPQFRLLDRS
jgi:hypothetical protein